MLHYKMGSKKKRKKKASDVIKYGVSLKVTLNDKQF